MTSKVKGRDSAKGRFRADGFTFVKEKVAEQKPKAANIQRLKRIYQDNNLLLTKIENIMSGTGAGHATFHKE